MVIKTDKSYLLKDIGAKWLFLVSPAIVIKIVEPDFPVMWMVILITCGLGCELLRKLRVIILNEYGCTIRWFWKSASYEWSDFKLIREEIWTTGGNSGESREGIIFSVKPMPSRKFQSDYHALNDIYASNDFCRCFYVIFRSKEKRLFGEEYPVDREMFLGQLDKWGVPVAKARNLEKIRKERRERAEKKRKKAEKAM